MDRVEERNARIDDLLDVTAAATLLGRSENTVRRLIREGDLPAHQVQGARSVEYRLRSADVHRYLECLDAKAPSHPPTHGRLDDKASRRLDAYGRDEYVGVSEGMAPSIPGTAAAAGIAGVQALIEQATAPLLAENRRLQEANERLMERMLQQAEELGRLREHLTTLEEAQAEQAERVATAAPSSDRSQEDDCQALGEDLAARIPPGAPSPPLTMSDRPPRRSVLARVLRRPP